MERVRDENNGESTEKEVIGTGWLKGALHSVN